MSDLSSGRRWAVLWAAALFLGGCASTGKPGEAERQRPLSATRSLLKTKVESAGVGWPDPRSRGSRARRLSAKRGALENGVLELTSAILALETESGALLRDRSAADPFFTEKVRRLARRADVVRIDWTGDDGCILRLELSRKRVEKKLGVLLR